MCLEVSGTGEHWLRLAGSRQQAGRGGGGGCAAALLWL